MRSPLRVRACAAVLEGVFAVTIKRRPHIRLPIRQRTRVLEQWWRLNRAANGRVAPTAGSRALHSPVLLAARPARTCQALSLFPSGLVRRLNRTRRRARIRHRGRIGTAFRRGLPRQASELATSGNLHESAPGSEGSSPFFVENAECRQADVEDLVFTKDNFVAHSSLASHRIKRRRCSC